jgi:hypothetical protein
VTVFALLKRKLAEKDVSIAREFGQNYENITCLRVFFVPFASPNTKTAKIRKRHKIKFGQSAAKVRIYQTIFLKKSHLKKIKLLFG